MRKDVLRLPLEEFETCILELAFIGLLAQCNTVTSTSGLRLFFCAGHITLGDAPQILLPMPPTDNINNTPTITPTLLSFLQIL
jgi:hypothetical protein